MDEQFQRTVNSYQTDNVNPNDWQDMNYSDFVEMTRTLRNPLVNIVYSYDGVVQLDRKLKKMTAKLSKMLILPEYFRQIIDSLCPAPAAPVKPTSSENSFGLFGYYAILMSSNSSNT